MCDKNNTSAFLRSIKIYFFIFTIISLITIYGCKEPGISQEFLSEEFKSWGNFKVGTYWIYKEINSGIEDSCYVYQYDSTMHLESFPDEGKSYIEVIESRFISTSSQDSFKLWINTAGIFVNLKNISSKSVGGEDVFNCTLVVPPPTQGQQFNTGPINQVVIFDSVFDSYSVGINTFQDIVRANDNMNMAYNRQQTYFYTARNIGIIKKVFPDASQSWNLVRFNIVR
jgi:hypothetical protein